MSARRIKQIEKLPPQVKLPATQTLSKKPGKSSPSGFNLNNITSFIFRIPLTEKLFFIEHLKVLVKAGLSISDALKTLAEQTENKNFRQILSKIKSGIEKGDTLAKNLAKFPRAFPKIFVSMTEAGEISGTLEENLNQLAIQMKKEHNLRVRVRSALTYPIVVLVATAAIVTILLTYVVPRIVSIFEEMEADLPLPTKILITVDNFILEHYIATLIIIFVLIAGFIFIIRTPAGKSALHKIFLNLPILAPIVRKVNLARFSRTLSSLLKTDIPVVQSFETTADVLANVHYKKIVIDAAEKLKKGSLVSESLEGHKHLFPPVVTQMINTGEKSGNLDELLEELAVFYEEQVDETVKGLSSIIEPLLILFLGVVVGGIALAIIAPMYSLSEQI
jgi:type IV pilus assembly protein PilC